MSADRFHLRREIERTAAETTEANGKSQASESATLQINFSGTLEVLAVDKRHEPIKWKVSAGTASIRRPGRPAMSRSSSRARSSLFPSAAARRRSPILMCSIRCQKMPRKVLPIVFEATGSKGDASLGEMLDNPNALRNGSWKVDARAAAAALHGFDPNLKPSQVSGVARVKSFVGDGPKQSLIVEYEFKAESKNPANLPAGMTPVSATLTESGTVSLPANASTSYFMPKRRSTPAGRSERP